VALSHSTTTVAPYSNRSGPGVGCHQWVKGARRLSLAPRMCTMCQRTTSSGEGFKLNGCAHMF
jgi:hypothetical protein